MSARDTTNLQAMAAIDRVGAEIVIEDDDGTPLFRDVGPHHPMMFMIRTLARRVLELEAEVARLQSHV